MSAGSNCQLYLITPSAFALAAFSDALKRAFDGGPVAAVQLRLKGASDDVVLRAAEALKPLCAGANAALILNDRADLAKACGADGVHLGQGDGDVRTARALLGADAQIGVTCHGSRHLAMEAGEAGADYVAFGAFFPSITKEPPAMADIDLLHWWAKMMEVPCVAIGGITPDNAAPLIAAGADFLAVSAAVWAHPEGSGAAVGQFNTLFQTVRRV
jgi:thiamine-phosphate pyrophosphorylase